MTRRERLERKLEKREEWAEKAKQRSATRFGVARSLGDQIPMGQPILVGHHSEKRHRRHLGKIDSNMRKGVEESDKASDHVSKAGGIEHQLRTSIFSDDADALEQLRAKIAHMEGTRDRNKQVNKIVRRKPKNEPTAEKLQALCDLLHLKERGTAAKFFEPDFCGRVGIAAYVGANLSANISRCRKRLVDIEARQQRTAKAEAAGGVLIERTTVCGSAWAEVTFAEKPEREILQALRNAGYQWGGGSWGGYASKLPAEVAAL